MRTIVRREPNSIVRSASTTVARPAAFWSGATESSRSRHTASAVLAAAFAIIDGRDAGTNSRLRAERMDGVTGSLPPTIEARRRGGDVGSTFATNAAAV